MYTVKASRFRRLIGTMSPPEDSDKAEIYVEVRDEKKYYTCALLPFRIHISSIPHVCVLDPFWCSQQGKRKNVEGFIRWCSKGSKNVGLSQAFEVVEVTDEIPTGLYDDFYVKTAPNEWAISYNNWKVQWSKRMVLIRVGKLFPFWRRSCQLL